MKEIKTDDVVIEIEELPRSLKFEADKTYEVEIDLQRFPVIKKFRRRNGKEYVACIYNIRVLKEGGKSINSEWIQRRVGIGDYREENNLIGIKPRMFSEFWQLARIYHDFGAGIHKCIVRTRKGNKGQILVKITHSNDCECLKDKEGFQQSPENLQISHPEELAEKIKEMKKEKIATPKEIAEEFNVDEEMAGKALEFLVDEGFAVKIKENKYYISKE